MATVDLFLDVRPVADQEENRFGRNVSIKWIVERSGLRLAQGNPSELYGFPDFDPQRVLRGQAHYLVGDSYPRWRRRLSCARTRRGDLSASEAEWG